MKNIETALSSVKPKKGKYRMVGIDGSIKLVDLIPAEKSMRLNISDFKPSKTKKVWEYLFDAKGACRLSYEGSRPIFWWGNDSFMLYVENKPVYFDLMNS